MKTWLCISFILLGFSFLTKAQETDSLVEKITEFPNRFFSRIKNKTTGLDARLTKQTEKYLARLAKKEKILQKKLYAKDSLAAKSLFEGSQEKYAYYMQQIKKVNTEGKPLNGEYLPYIDSLKGSLSFLQQNKKLLDVNPDLQNKITGSLNGFNQLQSKLEVSAKIREFISQRKQQLTQTFGKYGNLLNANKYLDDYKKQVYYYGQQVKEYKEMLNDPDKLEKKALALVNKLPAFQHFMKEHSMLASLLNMPGNISDNQTVGQGLPSRDQVMSAIQTQAGAAGPNVTSLIQQNVSTAQGQIDALRNKLNAFGSSGGDLDIPNFKPNNQKTKTFFQRLEYGSNLQTAHGSYYFPTTTDLGLSVGYKINDKNSFGLGASYKVGWGSDIRHVNVSSQGAGLRSFIDMQIKKSFYASGGFEYNYQQPFNSISVVKDLSSWQQSGLVGISKIVSLKTKMLKKSKVQLLWDFLSYQQIPRTQPLKFRVGYNF
jgi:hypothetical protein